MYTSSLRCSPINWAICSVWNFLSTSNVRLKSAGPLLCIGGSPALGWNRNNRGADRLNIRYAGWVENRLVVVFSLTKTSQDDQTWRSRESGSQKAHDNALQPRERRGEKKNVHETIWLHTLDDFQTQCVWWNTFSFPCNSPSKVNAVKFLFQRKLCLAEVIH